MSRRNKQYANANSGSVPHATGNMPSGGNGQGGSRFPISGNINIQLGKKGLHVTGSAIEPVTVPLRAKQREDQSGQFPWEGGSGGGGGQNVIQNCILAATSLAQIAQQQFTLQQQAQAANQQLLTALTQVGNSMGMTMKPTVGKRGYQSPQRQYTGQQTKSRRSKQQEYQLA